MEAGSYSSAVAGKAENWLEVVIRMPALVQYYNVSKLPTDAPVVVANLSDMDAGPVDISVDGHVVEVVTTSERPDCVVEVVRAEQQGSSLRVDFRLPTNSVRGFVVLAHDGDKWLPIERSVAKR